jgi:hypothetical protein
VLVLSLVALVAAGCPQGTVGDGRRGRAGTVQPLGVGIIAKDPGIVKDLVHHNTHFLTQ